MLVKITVSLDTQVVITQPSPLRIKAGAFVSIAVAFTRGARIIALSEGAVIELAVKPRNQWTGGLLAYLNAFELESGNIYTGILNCASLSLLSALGISDSVPANDHAQLEASAEITWTFNGLKFRSSTFPLIIETPLTDANPIPAPDPEVYPPPATIALKSELPQLLDLAPYALKSEIPVTGTSAALDVGVPNGVATLDADGKLVESQLPGAFALKTEIPVFATEDEAADGLRSDVVMSPLDVVKWFEARLPGNAGLALLGDDSWGLPDLSAYSGALAGDGSNVSGVTGIGLGSQFGLQFYDDGSGQWISGGPIQVPSLMGTDGASLTDDVGVWRSSSGIDAPWFSGDGAALSGVNAIQLSSPYGASLYDIGDGSWLSNAGVTAPLFAGSFTGDGSLLTGLNELDPVFGAWLETMPNISAFTNDAGYLSEETEPQFNEWLLSLAGDSGLTIGGAFSCDSTKISSDGLGNIQVSGSVTASSFFGDGSQLTNIVIPALNSPYGSAIYDEGWGSWHVTGNLSAGTFFGSFSGDGSGLSNVYATPSQLYSSYGYSIYDTGSGNWHVDGELNANRFSGAFVGDGSGLYNVSATPGELTSSYGLRIYDSGSGSWQVEGTVSAGRFYGAFTGDGSGLSNVYATTSQLTSPYGYSIYDAGWGNWQVNGSVTASHFSGDGSGLYNVYATPSQLTSPYGYSIYDTGWGNWSVNGNMSANRFYGAFTGDGSGLSNVYATPSQLTSPYGSSIYDAGWGNWQVNGSVTASRFSGDGSGLYNVYATPSQLTSPYGYTIYDTGWGNWSVNGTISANRFYGAFTGDGSGLSNVYATPSQLNSPYGYSIYDAGWGNWQVNGSITASHFSGDGSGLSNVYATPSQITSPYGYSIYDTGWGNWQVSGNMSASTFYGAFSGDGSGLYNVYATPSQLTSPYGYSISDMGGGNWQVLGSLSSDSIYGSFSGDGSFLQNVSAQNAYCDEYGNCIFGSYAQQTGYYSWLGAGTADLAYEADHASRASSDDWGNQLYGAGNIQWDFFGGSPSPGDVATFDGANWRPAPAALVPLTVASAAERFGVTGLKTGGMVKQLDNRTVYLVLDPKDCGSELGWVPIGPFILIPANSESLAIDNMSPALGDTITCSTGSWSDNPTGYAYQWYRNGESINDATSASYTVMPEDNGCSLQCVVSASNAAGAGSDSVTIPLVSFPA